MFFSTDMATVLAVSMGIIFVYKENIFVFSPLNELNRTFRDILVKKEFKS